MVKIFKLEMIRIFVVLVDNTSLVCYIIKLHKIPIQLALLLHYQLIMM